MSAKALDQLQPFVAVFPQECTGQLAPFDRANAFHARQIADASPAHVALGKVARRGPCSHHRAALCVSSPCVILP